MRSEPARAIAIALFALAAVLVGLGNSLHARWLTALAFAAFAGGVIAFLRWRRTLR